MLIFAGDSFSQSLCVNMNKRKLSMGFVIMILTTAIIGVLGSLLIFAARLIESLLGLLLGL